MVMMLLGLLVLAFVALLRDDASGSDAIVSELDVSLTEFAVDGDLSAPAGEVVLNVVNGGAIEHDLQVRDLGVGTPNLASGGVDTLALGELEPGTYELFCSVTGHEASGMQADLVITEAGESAPTASGDEHDDSPPNSWTS